MKAQYLIFLMFIAFSLNAQNQLKENVLIVLPSNNKLLDQSTIDSYSLLDLIDCHAAFSKKGIEVSFAKSGEAMPYISDAAIEEVNNSGTTATYYASNAFKNTFNHIIPLDSVQSDAYNAILCLGSFGAIADYYDNKKLHNIIQEHYDNGGVIATIEHAAAALINVKLDNGQSLIKDKKVTTMDTDELLVGYNLERDSLLALIPFIVEEKMVELGANFIKAKRQFENRVIEDNRIITSGYGRTSTRRTVRMIIEKITSPTKKILIVVTSNDSLLNGYSTGYFLPEVIDYHKIIANGGHFEFDIASPQGGKAPMYNERFFLTDPLVCDYLLNTGLILKLTNTIPLSKINPNDYSAIHFAGGFASLTDFPSDSSLKYVTKEIYENNGVVSAVCHGTSALLNLKLSDGSYLLEGRKVTSRTLEEETYGGRTRQDLLEQFPIILEDEIKKEGAIFTKGDVFSNHIESDQRIVTGQGVPSTTPLAKAVLKEIIK